MTRADLEPDELVAWYSFLQAHHRVLACLDTQLRRRQRLPLASYEVLLWLAQSPGRSMKMADLARVALLSPSGLTRLVDRLVAAGLVERRPSGSDARVMLAHLTPKGLEKFREASPTHVEGIKDYFSSKLGPTDLQALARLLKKVNGEPQFPQAPAVGRSNHSGGRARVTGLR